MEKGEKIKLLSNHYSILIEELNFKKSENYLKLQYNEIVFILNDIEDKLTINEYIDTIDYCIGYAYQKEMDPDINRKYFYGKLQQKKILDFIKIIRSNVKR